MSPSLTAPCVCVCVLCTQVSRTYAAGCIALTTVDDEAAATMTLRPPVGLAAGVDAKTVDAHIEAFAKALALALPDLDISAESTAFARLLPMLTVNPALGALAAAGEAPMLKQNRFVIRVARSVAADGASPAASLHCLALGYVGALPNKPKPDEVLTVGSPNLLDVPAAGEDALGYQMTYALRPAQRKTLEEEMKIDHGVAEVPAQK